METHPYKTELAPPLRVLMTQIESYNSPGLNSILARVSVLGGRSQCLTALPWSLCGYRTGTQQEVALDAAREQILTPPRWHPALFY
jgi:hypothetical protein